VIAVTETELTVAVDGGELWVGDTGGELSPLILLHPGVKDSTIWDPVLPRLAARHRVVRYDVRGYGRSKPSTAPYRLLDDLLAVLDHLRLRRLHVVGCSMGGDPAVGLALAQPERVTGLVLVCPGLSGYPWPDEPELDAEYEALEQAGDTEGLVALAAREWAAAGTDEAVLAQLRSGTAAWPNEWQYKQEGEPTFDRLGELAVPTVLMVGDRDRPPLVASNEEAAARIPGCRLVRMPGVDHLPPLRAPDLVAGTILDHFSGLR
jgi:pimeloyl-ACP methyl ester carboxylesterase